MYHRRTQGATQRHEGPENAQSPPQALRELSWRIGKAGEKVTEAEALVFGKKGFRPHDGMKIYDAVRMVNHVLGCTTGQSLINYQLGPWPSVEPGSVRFWCKSSQRWRRTTSTMTAWSEASPPQDTEELEDNCIELASLPLLLMSLDQASSGWV